MGPLHGVKIIEVGGIGPGPFCGMMLSDMGADVIKVERLGGDPARKIGPFYHDDPDPEKSLYWLAYNTNKRVSP